MLEQKLQNRQPSGLGGVGLIAVVALAVLAGSNLFSRLEPLIGTLSSVLFIAFGCAVAWFLLNWFVMRFIYTSNADCLRVCRAYGKRERFMADIWFNQVIGYGAPEDVKKRFPGARTARATRAQCDFAPLALACKQQGRTLIYILQPDDAMRAHIVERIKKA